MKVLRKSTINKIVYLIAKITKKFPIKPNQLDGCDDSEEASQQDYVNKPNNDKEFIVSNIKIRAKLFKYVQD